MTNEAFPISSQAGPELRRAIERLYAVFSGYRLPERTSYCSHCVTEFDDMQIRSHSLRSLGPGELAKYSFKAMTTWGTVDDFRHFLPRILELVSMDGGGVWIDPEVVFGKLPYGCWKTWPQVEQRAIVEFLNAMWRSVLDRFPHPFMINSCLCSVGLVVDDLTGFLQTWKVEESASRALHFADSLECNTLSLKRNRPWKLGNAWWKDRAAQAAQVALWILHPDRLAELENAFFAFGNDDETAGRLSAAFNDLCRIQQITHV